MSEFLIADTHFFHKNIIDYCNRPFTNVDEMNEAIIERWNKTVSKVDNIYMLGDFALGGKEQIIEVGNRLNGRKTLVMGNHDRASIQTYYDAGFKIVSEHPIIIRDFIILSHEPMFLNEQMPYINIYGHVHNSAIYRTIGPQSACVSCERINYTPIALESLIEDIRKTNEIERPS